MGRTVKRGRILRLLFFLHIKNGLGLCFLVLSLRLVIRLRFGSPSPAVLRPLLTWLNLLSVQPQGRTLYRLQDRPEKRTEPILSSGPSKAQGRGRAPLRSKMLQAKSSAAHRLMGTTSKRTLWS